MKLSKAMQDFILHWGDMGAKWGTNRSVAQIHALLHISSRALTAEEIAETLNLARSNVSNGLKELQSMRLVTTKRELGDRRDHFTSIRDMFDLTKTVIESRREREYAPTVDALQKVLVEAESDGTGPEARQRIAETLETMEMFDVWYKEVRDLPKGIQLAVLKLGAKVARFLPKGSG